MLQLLLQHVIMPGSCQQLIWTPGRNAWLSLCQISGLEALFFQELFLTSLYRLLYRHDLFSEAPCKGFEQQVFGLILN